MRRAYKVAILFVGCAMGTNAYNLSSSNQTPGVGHQSSAVDLAMGQWRFVTIGETPIMPTRRQPPYLKFEARSNTVTGSTGCNRLSGTYRADEGALIFEHITHTMMACADQSYEQQVLKVLASTTKYKITGHELHLLGPKGTLAVLVRPHEEQTSIRDDSPANATCKDLCTASAIFTSSWTKLMKTSAR